MTEIYTIGHGRHEFAYFLQLLRKYGVGFVCDVRSVTRSRWLIAKELGDRFRKLVK